jgi:nitroreductase/dihydropteridine reductase
MNIAHIAQTRHSCKAFDPQRKLSPDQLQQLQDLLYWAPSSINAQPWHFFLASSAAGKDKIAQSMAAEHYAYNATKVRDAALAVVLCAKTDLSAAHIDAVLAQEAADGRFASSQGQTKRRAVCLRFIDFRREQGGFSHWLAMQSYIALGQLLLGAAAMGLDACPIEGFDAQVMDENLGLRAQGLRSMVAVAVGWRSADDFNAEVPKSRLPPEQVLTWL